MLTLMFGDYEFPNQTFVLEGLNLENNIIEENITRRHGSNIQYSYLKSRKLQVSGTIHNTTEDASLTELLAMQKSLLAGEDKLYYRSDRYINCYAQKIIPDIIKGGNNALLDVNINFIAQNPFAYSAGASYSFIENHTGGTNTFAATYDGNVFSEPIISVCPMGSTISSIELWNLTNNNQSFKFTGTMGQGLTVKFDTDLYTVLNDGVDGITYFNGEFLTIIPGINQFQVSGLSCIIEIEYKNRWYT